MNHNQSNARSGKRVRRISLALVVLLAAAYALFLAFRSEEKNDHAMESSPIEASAIYRSTVSAARSLVIYEARGIINHPQSSVPSVVAASLTRARMLAT